MRINFIFYVFENGMGWLAGVVPIELNILISVKYYNNYEPHMSFEQRN